MRLARHAGKGLWKSAVMARETLACAMLEKRCHYMFVRFAFLDDDLVNDQAVHECVALNLTALNVETFALVGLARRRDPAISVSRHAPPLSACQVASMYSTGVRAS